jgi:hypothetical protein
MAAPPAPAPPGAPVGALALARPPFRFEPRRARLDWRLLAALDADRIARETDIDALERALDTVSFGDVTVEDPRHLSGAARTAARRGAARPANRLSACQKGFACLSCPTHAKRPLLRGGQGRRW